MERAVTKKRSAAGEAGWLLGEQIRLRPVAEQDLLILQAWDDDPALVALMGRRFQNETATAWLAALRRGRTHRCWMMETHQGRPIGEVELAQINRRNGTAEVRICIGEHDCWSHGFGTDALRTVIAHGFAGLRLKTVYLRVFATNDRALRVYRRLGFRKEAVLRPSERRGDPAPVVLMSLSAEQWRKLATPAAQLTTA